MLTRLMANKLGLTYRNSWKKADGKRSISFVCPDGKARWIKDELRLMKDKGEAVQQAVGVMIDITELVERKGELEALYRFSQVVAGTLNMEEVAREVVATCVKRFGVKLAWVGKAEEDGSVSLVAQYSEDIDYPRQIKVRWDEAPEGKVLWAELFAVENLKLLKMF